MPDFNRKFLFFVFWGSICCWVNPAGAQVDKKHDKQYISPEWEQELLSMLEEQLAQASEKPLHFYFLEKIEAHCKDDLDCQWDSYWVVMDEVNALKLYLQCIPLTEKLLDLAKARGDEKGEISTLWKLGRFYIFMEDFEMESKIHLQLLAYYEKSGDVSSALYIKTLIAEDKALHLNRVDEAIAEMKELIAQATELGLERRNIMLTRLYIIYEEFGITDELPAMIAELEKIPVSDPPKIEDHQVVFSKLSARALLAWEAQKYDQAEALFQEVLAINDTRFDGKGDLWYEIDTRHRLARMEWERGQRERAKAILAETYKGAVAFQMHDHISENLELSITMAEAENRFADALEYTRKFHAHRARVDSVSANFDAQRFYTQLANERLQSEKDSQHLELRLKNNQLLILSFAGLLVLLLAAGLLRGYRLQQKRRKELHEQNLLIQAQSEQLQSLDKAKTRFFANVSHELRTPLTLITGPVDTLLKNRTFAPEETRLLEIAKRNGQQLQKLINEILDLQKMASGKMELHTRPTDLFTFFESHLAQFESLAESREISYQPIINIAENTTGLIDQEKCRQLLNNLLSNAFKFTPQKGQIKADIALEGQQLTICVCDSGEGIHPDDLPHIFDPYFQTNRPEKPIEGGTGIGLALCKELVQLFGGEISAKNKPQGGAMFTLSFPLELSQTKTRTQTQTLSQVQIQTQNQPTSSTNQGKPSLLIVEDNPELRDYLSLILQDTYHITTAENGLEALKYLQPDPGNPQQVAPCQLILSDLMMPQMDGYQLVEQLKSSDATRHLPVVMLTARADARDRLKALRLGVDDYLLKPFDEEELKVRIANLLANQAIRFASMEEEGQTASVESPQPILSEADQEWLITFEVYVLANFSSDILSVPDLAEIFAMSESSLYRQLKRLIGLSPGQYLKEVRLDQARQLLEDQSYQSVEAVAHAVGYGDFRAFSRSFKERYGKLPSRV